MPEDYFVELVALHYGCTPSVARAEIETRNPYGYIERLMEMSAYANTKQALDDAPDGTHKPTGYYADLVTAIEFELVAEWHASHEGTI